MIPNSGPIGGRAPRCNPPPVDSSTVDGLVACLVAGWILAGHL